MNYTVWYRRGLFWNRVKNVIGDATLDNDKGAAFPVRVLLLADNTRLEIPMACEIRFSPKRFEDIQKRMSDEAGQDIRIRKPS